MLVLVNPDDSNGVRNKDTILDHYARMINGKDADSGTRFFDEGYIQHNPLMADADRWPSSFQRSLKGATTRVLWCTR